MRQRLGWSKDYWVVGYVGRLAHIKGIDLLGDAFRRIQGAIPHARLLIVGSGEEERKIRTILRGELKEGLAHIESDVPHESLAEWYRTMDLFVMPSRYENYSNAVLEALACGVPFLVSDIGGNRRLVKTKAGWLFVPGSVDSLAQALEHICRDAGNVSQYGAMGRELVCKEYSWGASAERLEGILHSCLNREDEVTCRR
jgi:glycosyltransferase involved in cell wall biosynthesis